MHCMKILQLCLFKVNMSHCEARGSWGQNDAGEGLGECFLIRIIATAADLWRLWSKRATSTWKRRPFGVPLAFAAFVYCPYLILFALLHCASSVKNRVLRTAICAFQKRPSCSILSGGLPRHETTLCWGERWYSTWDAKNPKESWRTRWICWFGWIIPAISKSESESWFRWMRSDCRTKRLPRARPVAPVAPAGIAPHRFVLHRSRCDLLGEELWRLPKDACLNLVQILWGLRFSELSIVQYSAQNGHKKVHIFCCAGGSE